MKKKINIAKIGLRFSKRRQSFAVVYNFHTIRRKLTYVDKKSLIDFTVKPVLFLILVSRASGLLMLDRKRKRKVMLRDLGETDFLLSFMKFMIVMMRRMH